jgi:hypothetical protein
MVEERHVVTHTERVAYQDPQVYPPAGAPVAPAAAVSHSEVSYAPTGSTVLQRLVVFVFGIIQGLLVLRIVLLLLSAREGNDLVALVYNVTEVLVAPFRGILGQNTIAAGSTALDVAAIVAIIGWTILELVILGLIRVFRR